MKKSMGKWTLICGILGVVFYFMHDIIGARYYPGYEWMKQAVSDLTAADAPSFAAASALSPVRAYLRTTAVETYRGLLA